ncbi:stromal cell-derived factor 2-like [Tubulanus polymorphus]|uniref:stromal cell-derived factor 2-like n=1 Tax=Tubulanus polymorphus TaxID=672921 RepID=UPI003DA60924
MAASSTAGSYVFGLFLTVFGVLLALSQGKEFEYQYVTCGSVLKLLNIRNNVRLHSHDVKYGSGSGQQSVTGVGSTDDHNSYWTVKGKMGSPCVRGTPIKCGHVIRLTHLSSKKNLHSHHFSSPLSGNQEVSAFGDKGGGDEGDHWSVECEETYWDRGEHFQLKHVVTGQYLHVSGDTYGRPIHGQKEISAHSYANHDGSVWKVMEGIYVKPNEDSMLNGATGGSSVHRDEL